MVSAADADYNGEVPDLPGKELYVACPYFRPESRSELELWQHRARLPLGDGYCGTCTAPGHEGYSPSNDELKSACNLGYAKGCTRLPSDPIADAVRFCLVKDDTRLVTISYVREREHLPVDNGVLVFDVDESSFGPEASTHVSHLAKAYVSAYLRRVPRKIAAEAR